MNDVAQRRSAIDLKIKRWQSRLTRAHNAIVKLNRQRKRISNPKLMAKFDAYEAKRVATPVVSDVTNIPVSELPIANVLDIPADLKRSPEEKVERDVTDEVAKLLNPAAEITRKRLTRMDAKRRGRAKVEVDKTKMPLSGKAAKAYTPAKCWGVSLCTV